MLEFAGHLPADAFEVSLNLSRTGESRLHVGQDVLRSQMLDKTRLRDEASGLIARATEQEGFSGAMKTAGELLERVDAGGVERGHVAKAQDDDVAERVEVRGGFG